MIKTADRGFGVWQLAGRFDLSGLAGKRVALKANYNSADPFPASTHLDTLAALINVLRDRGAAGIAVAERSGMGYTPDVLEAMGVTDLARKMGFRLQALDLLEDPADWMPQNGEGFGWKQGYQFSRIFSDADAIVQTCCLKTHRFGGHFTMSLKNSVGMVARYDPQTGYDYMRELHTSPNQRRMIAEINTSYRPALVVMDALQGFTAGGPEAGKLVAPGLLLASADRVALDACGVALLRSYGTTPEISRGDAFGQEQIARAGQLGLGAKNRDEVEIVPLNDDARDACRAMEKELTGRQLA